MDEQTEVNNQNTTELKMSLYDLNKQAMNSFSPITEEKLCKKLSEMGDWFSYKVDRYFMVLCHEMRDYTILHFTTQSKKVYEATTTLKDLFNNRGKVLSIDFIDENDAYCIWIRDYDNENHAYYLFSYDIGVEEI